MPSYSVATTKDNLSRLIDKAMAGEEVIITRHGKPTVSLQIVADREEPVAAQRTQKEWMEWLRVRRERLPRTDISYLDLKRMDEEDGAH